MELVQGSQITIKEGLADKLIELGFNEDLSKDMGEKYSGTVQQAFATWEDKGQQYVTIDLCVEIPIECCEAIL